MSGKGDLTDIEESLSLFKEYICINQQIYKKCYLYFVKCSYA